MSAPPLAARLEVAVITADLDRLCRFYTDVVGLTWMVTHPIDEGVCTRHAVLAVGGCGLVHVFERPGYDPESEGVGTTLGRRGRVDHLSLSVASRPDLDAVVDRVVSAGASDGAVRDMGPVLLVGFTDPDGTPMQVTCPNPAFDPTAMAHDVETAEGWFDRVLAPVPIA